MDLSEDNRRHVLYFRVNDHDLTTSEYVKLKHNDQLATNYDYVQKLIREKQMYFEGDDIEVLYRSTDDVDYTLVESRPRATPTTGSASSPVAKVGLPSTSICHPTEKHTLCGTTTTDLRSSTGKLGADNHTARSSTQQLQ